MEDHTADQTEPIVAVSRRLYTQYSFERTYQLTPRPETALSKRVRQACQCNRKTPWRVISTYFPVVKFIRRYKVKEFLVGDFLAGLTVSFMHFPQAMGLGILASLRPEHGLYTTFFSVLVYLLFGTSQYISFGTNAVMALLTQTVVERQAESFVSNYNGGDGNLLLGNSSTPSIPTEEDILDVKVRTAAACCLLTGVLLSAMGLLRFGFLCTYMSDSFIGGFTTAASLHICTSQVPKMFGIKVKTYSGAGKLFFTYLDLFHKLGDTVIAEVIISVISVAVLLLVKICINERFGTKMKIPVPIDLIVVVVGTFVSHFAKFKTTLNVNTVGPIPSKFPTPFVPSLSNAGDFIADAVIMALLSLAMSISMAKLMAKKHGTQIDDNQELFAYGVGIYVSGFFSGFPAATGPPRTMLLSSLGSKTTLNGVPTVMFMLLVILVIGQLFVSLPISVVSAMVVVSVKDLLLQYRNLPSIWKINKYDFVIWIVTNSSGVLVDLNYGLFAGIGVSVLLVIVQSQLSRGHLLSRGQTEDVLADASKTRTVDPPIGVKIFRFDASLFFATMERFKAQLYQKVINPLHVKRQQMKIEKKTASEPGNSSTSRRCTVKDYPDETEPADIDEESRVLSNAAYDIDGNITDIIIDCSAMNYIDIGGKNTLQEIAKDYKEVDVRVRLAGLRQQGKTVLEAAGFFDNFPRDMTFFEVIDALESIKHERARSLQSCA